MNDLDEALREKKPDRLAQLYEKLGPELRFHPIEEGHLCDGPSSCG
ncbi:hypothetical protein [Kibdelosporangium philippinense]